MVARAHVLGRAFYSGDARDVAPELLNKIFVSGHCAGRIVEVEAYVMDDPASHSYRGPTMRNRVMFGPPGHLYVYFTYGMHFCANVVTGDEGDGQAVLIRALAPLKGLSEMRVRRPNVVRDIDLTNGPGKLTRAMAIGRDNNGQDLTRTRIRLVDDGVAPPLRPGVSTRIGISEGVQSPWRWFVPGEQHMSRPSPSPSPSPTETTPAGV